MSDTDSEPEITGEPHQASLIRIDETAARMARELAKITRRYSRQRDRLDNICLFADREWEEGGSRERGKKKKSKCDWADTLEIEMMLMHRDKILKMEAELLTEQDQSRRNVLDLGIIKHSAAIREIFATISKHNAQQEIIMAKLASDGAKIAVALKITRDRLEAAQGLSRKTDTELQSIAKDLKAKLMNGELFVVDDEPIIPGDGSDPQAATGG